VAAEVWVSDELHSSLVRASTISRLQNTGSQMLAYAGLTSSPVCLASGTIPAGFEIALVEAVARTEPRSGTWIVSAAGEGPALTWTVRRAAAALDNDGADVIREE
jgi:hypothetical protein